LKKKHVATGIARFRDLRLDSALPGSIKREKIPLPSRN
jgi:hypothetical protein